MEAIRAGEWTEIAGPWSPIAEPRSVMAGAAAVAAMTLATAAGAQVAIRLPFTPVPLTMQAFAVLLTGLVLTPRRAFAAQAAYVGAGMAGLPWLAGLTAWGAGAGPATLGYLAGFVLAAPAVALAARRVGPVAACVLGVVVIHACGLAVLAPVLGVSPVHAIALGTAPFLAGDAVKVVLAVAAARRIRAF